ncbi:MAG: HupE/UreJ family protein [Myxococcota bacterium]
MKHLLLLLAVLAVAPVARAHPIQFGALRLGTPGEGLLDVRLEYSGSEDRPGGAELALPDGCAPLAPLSRTAHGNRETLYGVFRCDHRAMAEGAIEIRSLTAGVEILASLDDGQGSILHMRANGPAVRFPLGALSPRESPALEVGRGYFALGLEHIAGGYDHLLFVLVLLFFHRRRGTVSLRAKAIVGTVTAFTVGHSVTLALATLGEVSLPPAPVEACIALSIALLAAELARVEARLDERSGRGLAWQRPWLGAGLFGLLHGLGFAGALRDAGVPSHAAWLGLLAFNMGVELGQLVFVAVALVVLVGLSRLPRAAVRVPAGVAYLAGSFATAWTLDRLAALGPP